MIIAVSLAYLNSMSYDCLYVLFICDNGTRYVMLNFCCSCHHFLFPAHYQSTFIPRIWWTLVRCPTIPCGDMHQPCFYHIFSLCQLTTLTIHNSLSLSLPAQNLPLSQIFPTIDSSSLRTDSTDLWLNHFFWASRFLFFSFFITFFGSVRQIKLAIRQLLGARKYSVSYCSFCDIKHNGIWLHVTASPVGRCFT